jgi:hypothetical protein
MTRGGDNTQLRWYRVLAVQRVKAALAFGCVGVLCGCMPQPKTPTEFRAAIRDGGFMTRLEEKTVPRGFDDAFGAVKRNTERCLNTTTHSSTPGTYGPETSSLNFRATVPAPTADAGELAVQMDAPNMVGDYPEGGVYILVADVQKVDAASCKITVYAGGKGGDIVQSIFDWAEGKSNECPEL